MATKRILITGMSGTGKSAVVTALSARGFRAVDLDTPDWSEWVDADPSDELTPAPGKDWLWKEDRIRALLQTADEGRLFVGGCAENMGRLFSLIDVIVLLSAPLDTIMARLESRSPEAYGSTSDERRKIARLIGTVEPALRASAHHEIDTSGPIDETVDKILKAALGT